MFSRELWKKALLAWYNRREENRKKCSKLENMLKYEKDTKLQASLQNIWGWIDQDIHSLESFQRMDETIEVLYHDWEDVIFFALLQQAVVLKKDVWDIMFELLQDWLYNPKHVANAQRIVYILFVDAIYTFFRKRLYNPNEVEDVEDLTSKVFSILYEKIKKKKIPNVQAYIFQIANNLYKQFLDSKKNLSSFDDIQLSMPAQKDSELILFTKELAEKKILSYRQFKILQYLLLEENRCKIATNLQISQATLTRDIQGIQGVFAQHYY